MSEVIGVISGILGIISFAQDNFAAPDAPSTKLRVQVGLDGTQGLSNAGGDAPDVRLFDENLGFLGINADPGYINSGGYRDITIGQPDNRQPTFALLTGNDDAVCIAYMSETWPDGQKYGWVGNWGETCGVAWYYSNIYIDNKKLDCTWLDKNGDATDVTAFHVHFPEFNDKGSGYNNDQNYYCNNVRALNFQRNNPDSNTIYTKRDVREEGKRGISIFNDPRLVRSWNPDHSAIYLCNSTTAAGPSFVSEVEGTYCDMSTKEVLPLCREGVDGECFDSQGLISKLGSNIVKNFSFSKVIEWANPL